MGVTKLVDDKRIRLIDFGIKVPLLFDRAKEIEKGIPQKVHLLNVDPVSTKHLSLAHKEEYIQALLKDDEEVIKCYELINSDGTFNRFDPKLKLREFKELLNLNLIEANATYESALLALDCGAVHFLGGGMHHAMSFKGGGFCLINDIVITLRRLQQEKKIETGIVIDVDAHKGDGTAEITFQDKTIKTLSIHMAKGWPLDNPQNRESFINSDIEIPVEAGMESEYIDKLKRGISELLKMDYSRPLAIVVAGTDPYEEDELLSTKELNLNLSQMLERDLLIYRSLLEKKIPQLWLLAGGYGRNTHLPTVNFLKFVGQNSF